jgi:hypothetical protein
MPVEKDILQQLNNSSVGLSGWQVLEAATNSPSTPSPGIHLAVLIEPFLGYILQGRKTVESRFSKHCIAPYQRIEKGDLVLLKAAAGPVVGYFTAAWIQCSELDEGSLADVQTRYAQAICADEEFWRSRAGKRYVTLVGVEEPRALPPIKVAKSDRRGWIVLRSAGQPEAQLSLL